MNKILNKNCLLLLFPIISFIGSAFQGQYIYDGFHLSVPIIEAKRYFNNEIPFKDFLIHYGFLKTFFDYLIFKIVDFNIYFFFLIYSFIYSLSILLISIITKKISSNNFALLISSCVFFIHPFLLLPWHNYLLFFLLLLFLYFRLFHNYAFSNLFLGLGYLVSTESFYLISFIIFFFSISLNSFSKNIFFFLKSFFYFFIPAIFFSIYLLYYNLFYPWFDNNKLTTVVFETFGLDYFKIILNFINNIFDVDFINLLFIQPYKLVFLIIFVFNFFYFFFLVIKKKEIALISFIALCMSSNAFYTFQLYKLSTGLIIGIIPIAFYLNSIRDINNKIIISFLFFLICLNSRNFFKDDTNPNFVFNYKIETNFNSDKFLYFKYLKWEKNQWQNYQNFTEKILFLKKKCNIKLFNNLTSDGFYLLLAYDFFKINQKLPWFEISNNENYFNDLFLNFLKNYEPNMFNNIIKFSDKLIIITSSNNYPKLNYKGYNINFADKFKFIKLTNYKDLIILYPRKCNF
jgi:hypothetical protein